MQHLLINSRAFISPLSFHPSYLYIFPITQRNHLPSTHNHSQDAVQVPRRLRPVRWSPRCSREETGHRCQRVRLTNHSLLLFLKLTYAVPPSTRSSRLPSPAPFWLSTLPIRLVSSLQFRPSWLPVRPPPGSLLFLRTFSHTSSTLLPPAQSSPMPPLLLLPSSHLLLSLP